MRKLTSSAIGKVFALQQKNVHFSSSDSKNQNSEFFLSCSLMEKCSLLTWNMLFKKIQFLAAVGPTKWWLAKKLCMHVSLIKLMRIYKLRGPWVQISQQKEGGKLRNQKAGNGLPTIICRKRNAPHCLSTFRNEFLLRVRWLRMNYIEHVGKTPPSGRIENLFYIDFNIYLIKNCTFFQKSKNVKPSEIK